MADILAVMDHAGIDKAHIVGLSMGGFATLHFGLHHPDRALSLCVAGCGYGAELAQRDRFREESSFRTYLFAVAHNLLKEHLRRKRRAPEPLDLDLVSAVDLGASPLSLMAAHAEEKI